MVLEEVFEKVKEAIKVDRPFVMYRKPDSDMIEAIVQKDKSLDLVSDFRESGFVMSPFDQSKGVVIFKEENSIRYDALVGAGGQMDKAHITSKITPDYEVQGKKQHLNLVKKGLDRIQKTALEKVVLSRMEKIDLIDLHLIELFSTLLAKYEAAFVYLWYHPEIGLWAGASPETLILTKGRLFKTMSLAGTQQDQGKEVTWGAKEIKEQQIVTDHLLDSLKGFSLELGPRYTKKAGNLFHLCNDIQGVLDKQVSLNDLVPLLHPTAAVCGFPKNKAQDFILNEEGYDRSFYTGFLGELNLKAAKGAWQEAPSEIKESNLFVNLRCMQLLKEPAYKAIVYVGGGITSESDPLQEWKETVDKSLVMKSVLYR